MPTERTDLNGLRLRHPVDRKIYLIDLGRKRYIPAPATYKGLFPNEDGVRDDAIVTDIVDGPDIEPGTNLSLEDGKVYLIDYGLAHERKKVGLKRHVVSQQVFDRYGFWGEAVQRVRDVLAAIEGGEPIS